MRKLCFLAALCSPFAQAEVVSVEANSMMRLPANVSVLRLEKLDVADYGTLLIPAGITQVDIDQLQLGREARITIVPAEHGIALRVARAELGEGSQINARGATGTFEKPARPARDLSLRIESLQAPQLSIDARGGTGAPGFAGLDGGNGEEWEHLCLPAIQPDGSALWPEKHSIERLRVMEDAAPYVFSGQYRQLPSPPAGGFFKPDRIEIVDALPAEFIKEVRAWDLAASENEGDWTAGPRMLKTKENMIYIVDMVRGRWGPDGVENTIKQTAQMDGKSVSIRLPQDPGQAGKSQAKNFITMLSGFNVKAETVSGDKITRAQPFAAQVNIGNVKMLRGDWNKALIEELRNFPNGTHDDQVDGCSDGFTELNEARIGKKPAGAGSRTYQ